MTAFIRELPTVDRFGQSVARGSAMYMGEPDGPMRFIKSLGMEVPTYIDPRNDLKTTYRTANAHVNVDYHVPPKMRGTYLASQLADYDPDVHYPLTATGKVRCGGLKPDGQICQKSAQNRTGFCSNHGGALHPADKLFAADRGILPTHPERLSRLSKVEMGIIPVTELSDEEISRMQVRQDDGTFSRTTAALSQRVYAEMRSEFFKRTEQFIRENTMDMLAEMKKIATSPVEEAKDKIAAATWLVERVLGKTPEIILTNKTDSPFEQMMSEIVSGSREDYRNGSTIEQPALPGGVPVIEGQVVDPFDTDEDEEFDEENEVVPAAAVPAHSEPRDPVEIAREKRELKDRIKRNRNRKYAAKSRGLDTTDDLPYEIEFKTVNLKSGPVTRMKLIAPDAQRAPKAR